MDACAIDIADLVAARAAHTVPCLVRSMGGSARALGAFIDGGLDGEFQTYPVSPARLAFASSLERLGLLRPGAFASERLIAEGEIIGRGQYLERQIAEHQQAEQRDPRARQAWHARVVARLQRELASLPQLRVSDADRMFLETVSIPEYAITLPRVDATVRAIVCIAQAEVETTIRVYKRVTPEELEVDGTVGTSRLPLPALSRWQEQPPHRGSKIGVEAPRVRVFHASGTRPNRTFVLSLWPGVDLDLEQRRVRHRK